MASQIITADLNQDDVKRAIDKLLRVSGAYKDKETRKGILRPAANAVVQEARKTAPKSERVHRRYSTPKLQKSLRAPKGKGKVVASYRPGNLRGSIRVLRLQKTVRLYIGPRIAKTSRGSKGEFGPGTGRFDAYYAQMVYGSAVAFRNNVMIPALTRSTGTVIRIIENQINNLAKRLAQKNGL